MGFGAMDGLLDALSGDSLKNTAMGALGGAAGGVGYALLENNVAFLSTGTPNEALLKRLGAVSAMAILGGMGLARVSDHAASGFVGGMGAQAGALVASRFAKDLFKQSPEVAAAKTALAAQEAAEAAGATPAATAGLRGVRGLRGVQSSRIALAGTGLGSTRSYTPPDLPANVGGLGRVNVHTPDPAELAALHVAF